jgi:CDP-6-deoxy-D-xylo-4-hexulose-3-dehydrase
MEGGLVLTDDIELFHLLRSVRAHGWTRDLPADTMLFERGEDEHFEAYRFIMPGYNVRPIELSGAIGREQIKKLPGFTEARRRNLAYFQSLFADDDRFIIQREHGKSSCFSFTLILNPDRGEDRNRVFSALRDAEIGFRMVTGGCFLRHEAIRYFDYEIVGEIENAFVAHDRGFFVGNHPFDLTGQIDQLHSVLNQVCSR